MLEAAFPDSSQFGDSSFWPSSTEGHTWDVGRFSNAATSFLATTERSFSNKAVSFGRSTPEHHVNGTINWDKEAAVFFTSILHTVHCFFENPSLSRNLDRTGGHFLACVCLDTRIDKLDAFHHESRRNDEVAFCGCLLLSLEHGLTVLPERFRCHTSLCDCQRGQ